MLRFLTVPRLPSLRTISFDFVIGALKRKRDSSEAVPYDEAVIVPALERIVLASHSIEQAHIRIPPSQRCIDLVESIIAKNTGLQSLCLEVDSTTPIPTHKPKILLNNLTLDHARYVPLQRFVIRAPTCDVHFLLSPHRQRPFFKRLAAANEFGLVCYNFASLLPNWYWVYTLLLSMPSIVFCDIAFAMPDDHQLPQASTPVRPFRLAHLQQLSIHIPEIDTHMLSYMDAPYLYILRLRSTVHIELWPNCPEDHFPSLFIVNIICPGPIGLRLDVLGIEYEDFYHNLAAGHEHFNPHRNDFLAYIKPYDRVRPKAPTAPYPALHFRRRAAPPLLPTTPSPSARSLPRVTGDVNPAAPVPRFAPASTPSSPTPMRGRLPSA
ncbi:hypothetical protein OC834_005516 [Tilletia horrida]|nr:hypothetical protein OC834_005516 [Tilletia horrida]KAK0526079.1 hypothetical protein OC835_005409 [Tilletia horrida]KAK0559718.1 hypothetical protein OC844_004219 [Tilletia horrida]